MGFIRIDYHFAEHLQRQYWAVMVDDLCVASFWHFDNALNLARQLEAASKRRLLGADVVQFGQREGR